MLELAEKVLGQDALRELLATIRATGIAVIGDFCLDGYWFIDETASEHSVETGLPTRPVERHRLSLGGAGNVVANLTALGVGQVHAFGAVGDDLWGRELRRLLTEAGATTGGLLTATETWSTLVYLKPHLGGTETNRIDFGNFNRLADADAMRLLARLENELAQFDAVVINEQVLGGLHTDFLRGRLLELIRRHPATTFIVDSRHHSDAYPGACLKLNDHEAARLIGVERPYAAKVLHAEAAQAAQALHARLGRPVFVTRGPRGCLVQDETGRHEIPGLQLLGRIDPVGAGDSMLAGIAAALAAGGAPAQAATLGNFVAGVTVQKLFVTGTASPAEVLALGADPDYIYAPELAEDPRQARRLPGTDFELVSEPRVGLRPRHAIFDHDGTISVLREGWEKIMEPVMVRAILGERFATADESLYHQVVARTREYIDQSTGIQTLVQMQGLVKMVREFGCVPAGQILDEFGYKKIYNDALMELVRERLGKLERGELGVEDYTLKNAVALLRALKAAGVRLYLASGTDEEDVRAEARALGYAGLFDGGIYGAVGDVTKEAKKMVLDRILREIEAAGADPAQEVVTFGDGPVEMRETHKRGGFALGVASDEVRRFGLNAEKRTRLIRAGADLIVPDFSQLDPLLALLNLK